jgi:3-phosphoshikimate 1-carboxyvinyltransferase
MAALGEGVSTIDYPLDSLDARSCVSVCRALGAEITEHRSLDPACPNPQDEGGKKLTRWTVRGLSGPRSPVPPSPAPPLLDVGNSGTTLFLALAAASLWDRPVTFTGDEQIARRGAGPLLEALAGLGVRVSAGKGGCVPITVKGPWKGGRVSLPCPTSQYLSALLLAAPLAPAGTLTEIEVPLLNERPYIELTLSYLKAQGIPCEGAADFSFFRIPGGGSYKPLNGPVPGDFSSAAFPAAAAAITGGPVDLLGLMREDPQGDKAFFDMLSRMGCDIAWTREGAEGGDPAPDPEIGGGGQAKPREWRLSVSRTGPLRGGEFDLNATPDLLPIMAVCAAYARGDTSLVNAAHARIKETDRIAVMAAELGKLGVPCRERPDGLWIHGTGDPRNQAKAAPDPAIPPTPDQRSVDGHGDHRIVMALAVAALGSAGPLEIRDAESAAVTYPGFPELLGANLLGADIV